MNPLRFLLAIYAHLERPLLRFNYWLVRSPLVRWPVTRQLLWLGVFLPISYAGAAGQPMTADEAVELLQAAGEEGVIAVGPCGCRTVHRLRDLRRGLRLRGEGGERVAGRSALLRLRPLRRRLPGRGSDDGATGEVMGSCSNAPE
jgi:hypothetical protein